MDGVRTLRGELLRSPQIQVRATAAPSYAFIPRNALHGAEHADDRSRDRTGLRPICMFHWVMR